MKLLVILKPCPFCGGKARISSKDVKFGGWNGVGDRRVKYRIQVICNKCHSRGKPITTDWMINPEAWVINGFIPEWNTEAKEKAEEFKPYINMAAEAWNNRKDGDGE